MTAPRQGPRLQAAVQQRVGGFFANTFRISGKTCEVCTGPATKPLCGKCAGHRAEFGDDLATRIFTLTYAQGNHPRGLHQSAHTLRSYKDPVPVAESQQNLQLVIAVATAIHAQCMQDAVGQPWDSVTFVPSVSRPGADHPVADLARQVRQLDPSARFLLDLGPGRADTSRDVRSDRFCVAGKYLDRVEGRHVLVVDDTWTTGCKLQSAAVVLRQAGAAAVTGLCVARWCRWDWADHAALLGELTSTYDPLRCPAQDGTCERGLTV